MHKPMVDNEKQFQPVDVYIITVQPQVYPVRRHFFHEFIFVRSGKGNHTYQDITTAFGKGELLFVPMHEEHSFEILEPSELFLIRYTEEARLILREMTSHTEGRAVALIKAKSPSVPKIQFGEQDEKLVVQLCEMLLALNQAPSRNEGLSYFQIMCLVTIIERNTQFTSEKSGQPVIKKNIALILNHIHLNLYKPELLKRQYMAGMYNMSVNTLSTYFQQEMGVSIKKYIANRRFDLIREKVVQSDLSFSEIAYQFGFTDESHFHKSFKTHFGNGPKDYRKSTKIHA